VGTNYFNPTTFGARTPTTTLTTAPPPIETTIPGAAADTGAFAGGPNSSSRAFYATLLAGLPQKSATAMGVARNNAKDSLRSYGGVGFGVDNPATPNVDESLTATYTPDQLGRNERNSIRAARSSANARGIMYSSESDGMVGAGLQRVGEEARGIVNQYATQINAIAGSANQESQGYIGQITSLYGQDATWDATRIYNEQQAIDNKALVTAQQGTTDAINAPKTNPPGTTVWVGQNPPNRAELDRRHGKDGYDVEYTNGRWMVVTK